MSRPYKQFIFKRYEFDASSGQLALYYGYDDELTFCETYAFEFDFVDYDEQVLDKALQLLFLVAGVSYYKAFLAPDIIVEQAQIDQSLQQFLARTYQHGLGEFFYVNQLDPAYAIDFPVNQPVSTARALGIKNQGQLIGLGGGKDSLVSIELLRKTGGNFATWSLNHKTQLTPLADKVGGKHLWVTRQWDEQLLELKDNPAAYNGHIPISAIFACVGTVVAILSGYRDVVVSNESSASEPTLTYKGRAVNHQYSKSLAFEKDFQTILNHLFGDGLRYYSFLRPLSEVRISEIFVLSGAFDKYKGVFSSCNRAFVHGESKLFWDAKCPKCAFVFLALTPFVERTALESVFGGKNLLLTPELVPTYKQLLGIEGDKPLECVGEVKESRAAMRLAQKIYPTELEHYDFVLPDDYDFRDSQPHLMPTEAAHQFTTAMRSFESPPDAE